MRIIVIGFLLLTIMACSSSATVTHYYLLNSQSSVTTPQVVNADRAKVQLSVTLASYLNQPYLVMQIDPHKLNYANSHMWAEPLASETEKALIRELNQRQQRFTVIANQAVKALQPQLVVNIDYFHVTYQSEVILSGHYILNSDLDNLQPTVEYFTYHLPLQTDGYSHSVAQMRSLINQLAQAIVASS